MLLAHVVMLHAEESPSSVAARFFYGLRCGLRHFWLWRIMISYSKKYHTSIYVWSGVPARFAALN